MEKTVKTVRQLVEASSLGTASPPWPAAAWTPSRTRRRDHASRRDRPQAPQSCGDIFAVTCIKTAAVFVVIGFFCMTGIY